MVFYPANGIFQTTNKVCNIIIRKIILESIYDKLRILRLCHLCEKR